MTVSPAFLSAAIVLTALVVALLAAPLVRGRRPTDPPAGRLDHDLAVYRDQRAEIDRDLDQGLLTAAQAEAARIEIERRMLAAADAAGPASDPSGTGQSFGRTARLAMVGVIAVLIPAGAGLLYSSLGRPGLADRPAAEVAAAMPPMETLVEELARRLAASPERVDGWILLARSQTQLERYGDAARSYNEAISRGATDADTQASYGEVLILAAEGGPLSPEARAALEAAFRADPLEPRSYFYLGADADAEGDPRRAIALWRRLEERSPGDAPWLAPLRQRIASAATAAGIDPTTVAPADPVANPDAAAPTPADPAAPTPAAGFTAEQRQMIESMVRRLADRLATAPDDFDGWMRLGQSYRVLGQADKAADAFDHAVALRPDDAAAREALSEARAMAPAR